MFTSVFNDVLGPVMRGPSSSHTAGSYHIGCVVRHLLLAEPRKVKISFDKNGSYGRTYVQQGVDQAFATGIMGWKQTDEIFTRALAAAREHGVHFEFLVTTLSRADHPNHVVIEVEDEEGKYLAVEAKSVGGGTFLVTKIDTGDVLIDGKRYELFLTIDSSSVPPLVRYLENEVPGTDVRLVSKMKSKQTLQLSSDSSLPTKLFHNQFLIQNVRHVEPVYFTRKQQALFCSAAEMIDFAVLHHCSLGEALLEYEKAILGISEEDAINEMLRRYGVMKNSVSTGLHDKTVNMQLLDAMAGTIMDNINGGRVAIGGLHAKAAAAAMAAMHCCNSRGVVCAAPTGGAAGTIPGILTALDHEFEISDRKMALMLFAAGGIGLILAIRGTFAAEVAGCQVEIGAAGAMGAAAVVEFADGTARQACDAAAISFQNTMGLVCDLVQGMCEIPCHTRNAAAASSAFTNADMVLGGYINHINLDETIDAVYASGRMLPDELRCTARGGLAIAPSAMEIEPR